MNETKCRKKLNAIFRNFFDTNVKNYEELTFTEREFSLEIKRTINNKVEIIALVMLFDKYETVLIQRFGFSSLFIDKINNTLKSQKIEKNEVE